MPIQTIHDINFAALYINHKKLAARPPSQSERWDQQAQKTAVGDLDSAYTKALIAAMRLEPNDTLLDVGCGVGNVAVLVAPSIKLVYALDYSQGMLDKLQTNMHHYNTHNIKTLCKDWADGWQDIPLCEIVVASRSTLVEDMEAALLKMHAHATRHVYLTYPAKNSFGANPAIDTQKNPELATPSYTYILNILHQHGIYAQARFIDPDWVLIDWAVQIEAHPAKAR